jgi:hypothetical protein
MKLNQTFGIIRAVILGTHLTLYNCVDTLIIIFGRLAAVIVFSIIELGLAASLLNLSTRFYFYQFGFALAIACFTLSTVPLMLISFFWPIYQETYVCPGFLPAVYPLFQLLLSNSFGWVSIFIQQLSGV